jgi:5-methyltetrahydropteroyltriglutamate--homocysteine methyltransferase
MKILTHNLGFPRIGPGRELKHALESYWAGKSDESMLLSAASSIRRQNWQLQQTLGIDLILSNEPSATTEVSL